MKDDGGTWLVYCHTPSSNDVKHASKAIKTMRINLSGGTAAYVLNFGRLGTPATLSFCKGKKQSERNEGDQGIMLGSILCSSISQVPDIIKDFGRIIRRHCNVTNRDVDGVFIWSHGAGFGLGPWKRWKEPFITITDAVDTLIRPFKVPLVVFDACFQGSMSCLYEMPKEVRYVVAPTAFHPFTSVMAAPIFGKLPNKNVLHGHAAYAKKLCCEWNSFTSTRWKCLLVFNLEYILPIADLVKRHLQELNFDKKSQIDREDANLHDLYTAARMVPALQSLCKLSVMETCPECLDECTKKVHGPSMEAHLPRKWVECYTNTRWYKKIVKDGSRFQLSCNAVNAVTSRY